MGGVGIMGHGIEIFGADGAMQFSSQSRIPRFYGDYSVMISSSTPPVFVPIPGYSPNEFFILAETLSLYYYEIYPEGQGVMVRALNEPGVSVGNVTVRFTVFRI